MPDASAMQATQEHPPPPVSPQERQSPAPPEPTGWTRGRVLRLLWRIAVALQAGCCALLLISGLFLAISLGRSNQGATQNEWAGLFMVFSWGLVVFGTLTLAWSLGMFIASFFSKLAAAIMGTLQGVVVLAAIVPGASADPIELALLFILTVGWFGLCASCRIWPDRIIKPAPPIAA